MAFQAFRPAPGTLRDHFDWLWWPQNVVRVALTTMRRVPVLMLAVLLLAVPARADESTVVFPAPEAKPAKAVKTVKPAKRIDSKRVANKEPAKAAPAKTSPAVALPKLPPPKPAEARAEIKAAAANAKPAVAKAIDKGTAPPDVFVGIPPAERLKIQAALLWSGDYTVATNGDDPMLAAIKNFQKRKKASVTGTLTAAERAELIGAAREHEQEFGWTVVVDPATGIRIGLPAKMLPHAQEAARGTRWSSAHGEVQVETFRIADPGLKLADLFEREKKEPASRKVEYSVLHDDSFYISGLQGLKKFGVRAYIRNGEVRGFTMLFDQMMETIVTPVTVAMASAFTPFPERSAPFAALARSVEYGNGLVVSEKGHIVTDRKLAEGCQVLVASGLGDAVRVADDKDLGLALLRVYLPRKAIPPLALPTDAPKSGELILVGIPDPKEQDGSGKLTEIKARLADGNAIELPQPVPLAGFSGAAAIDGGGRLLGMMEMRNAVLASLDPATPPVRLVGAQAIRGFLSAHNVPAPVQTGEAKSAVVRMICVRK